MSSRLFAANSNVPRKGKAKSTPKVEEESKEPVALWEFDDEHDAPSIICEVVYESIISEPNFSMAAYHNLASDSNNALNKSDIVCLVSAAILERMGLKESSKRMRALSDQVSVLYKNLNLETPGVLNQFVTLVAILNPEVIKTVESAVLAAMFVASRKTKAHHTTSRIQTAFRGVVSSESAKGKEVSFGAIGSNVKMTGDELVEGLNTLLLDYTVEDYSDQEIEPEESASSSGAEPRERLSEKHLMQAIASKRDHHAALLAIRKQHKAIPDPIKPKGQTTRRGLGMSYEKFPAITTNKGMNMRRASSIAAGEEKTGLELHQQVLESLQSAQEYPTSAKVTEEEAGDESSEGGI